MESGESLKFVATYLVLNNGKEILTLCSTSSNGLIYVIDPLEVSYLGENQVAFQKLFMFSDNRINMINPSAIMTVTPMSSAAEVLYKEKRLHFFGELEVPSHMDEVGNPRTEDAEEPIETKASHRLH